ncbi:Hypothetical predicted protein [Octopus vulgaris]|uniref:Uncharacterized protein n=1 Tax=Octopus vulgaris TaxID=6645 RepID=A0AA36AVJ7_OCTVU|nr:Hypothetical predicted protein [Octopus vulgaris]
MTMANRLRQLAATSPIKTARLNPSAAMEKFLAICVRIAVAQPRSPQTIYSANGFVFLICLKKPNVDGVVGTAEAKEKNV